VTDRLHRALDDTQRRCVPDRRLGVFEISLRGGELAGGPARVLAGCTTSREALASVRRLAAEAGIADDVRLLPDASIGAEAAAIVLTALAPLHEHPDARAARASEALHGERLVVLQQEGAWLRVRAEDGYHAWVHAGYVARGPDAWADDWSARATSRSLGAELKLEDGRLRLPVGARVGLRFRNQVEVADGRIGSVVGGVVRGAGEAGVEARLLAAPEWALRWLGGAPYVWGGRTEWGVDCSGLVQTTYAVRGVAVPRDADLQFDVGRPVAIASDGSGYEAGDLLFFADAGRVTHVALWAGAGRIVHAAVARGGVASDDLFGTAAVARTLRDGLVGVRRLSAKSQATA
jgi:hypothetical protein